MVRLCAERRIAIVPQGGNTSMVGGAVPDKSGRQTMLSLRADPRAVRDVNPVDLTLTVEAGITLKAAQDADGQFQVPSADLDSVGRHSQDRWRTGDQCCGNTTVHYGNARDLVLGLEAVLPDGQCGMGYDGFERTTLATPFASFW